MGLGPSSESPWPWSGVSFPSDWPRRQPVEVREKDLHQGATWAPRVHGTESSLTEQPTARQKHRSMLSG